MLVVAAKMTCGNWFDEAPLPGAADGVLDDAPAREVELLREVTSGALDDADADAELDSRVSALVALKEVSSAVLGFDVADADKAVVSVTEGILLANVGLGPVIRLPFCPSARV